MAFHVRIDASELDRLIGGYISRQRNYPMSFIAQAMATEVDAVIDSQGRKGADGRWKPFSEATLRRHPRRRGGRLLQDTGVLANIQMSSGADWAEVWSPAAYAKFHVTGTKKMPKRNPLAIDWKRLLQQASEDLLEEIE